VEHSTSKPYTFVWKTSSIFIYLIRNAAVIASTKLDLCKSARWPPYILYDKRHSKSYNQLQLDVIIEQSDFFEWLESRHPNIRASITAESVTQTAIPTGSDLPLDSEVNLCKIINSEL
jgi:hypothetical protein